MSYAQEEGARVTLPDSSQVYRDPKRWLWLLSLLAPVGALLPSVLVGLTQVKIFWWFGVLAIFLIIPVIDWFSGTDGVNPPDWAYKQLTNDKYYRWCTYLFIPILYTAFVIACYLWADPALSVVDKTGLAVTIGLFSGMGINAAHELGHRHTKHERLLAKLALAQSSYGHFFVEHNHGHHARVATPEDPASARLGERLYEFVPRSVVFSLISGWGLEMNRLHGRGHRVLSWRNEILQAWAMTLVLFGAVVAIFGFGIVPYLILQAAVAITMLETVNYIEHYGLRRVQREDGRYAPIRPEHSWNSDQRVSNLLMFQLQRHSDHHAHPGRRYQTLRSLDEAPQHPSGYASMILLAMSPFWMRVMGPRVLAFYNGDVTRANIAPQRRAKMLARYGAPAAAAEAADQGGSPTPEA